MHGEGGVSGIREEGLVVGDVGFEAGCLELGEDVVGGVLGGWGAGDVGAAGEEAEEGGERGVVGGVEEDLLEEEGVFGIMGEGLERVGDVVVESMVGRETYDEKEGDDAEEGRSLCHLHREK